MTNGENGSIHKKYHSLHLHFIHHRFFMPYYVPTVIEKSHRGERAYDIYSRLLMDRIIFLGTQIDDQVANAVIAPLLFLQQEDAEKDIHMYINSPVVLSLLVWLSMIPCNM